MSYPSITLKKGEGRTLKSGGLWVFDNEIAAVSPDVVNGEMVSVLDFDGYPMGVGFYNHHSKITVRMMSRHADTVIDEAFLRRRVEDAWYYRKKTVDTSSCRVIFGEADYLPGLVVDKFSDVLVVQSLALGIDRLKETIVRLLLETLAKDGINIRGVYERSDAKVRLQEGMERILFLSTCRCHHHAYHDTQHTPQFLFHGVFPPIMISTSFSVIHCRFLHSGMYSSHHHHCSLLSKYHRHLSSL